MVHSWVFGSLRALELVQRLRQTRLDTEPPGFSGRLCEGLTSSFPPRLEVRCSDAHVSKMLSDHCSIQSAGFLYIASVSVIPELLAESRSIKQTLKEVSPIKPNLPCHHLLRLTTCLSVRLHDVRLRSHGSSSLERVMRLREFSYVIRYTIREDPLTMPCQERKNHARSIACSPLGRGRVRSCPA